MGPPGPGGPGTPGAPEGAMPPPTAPAEPHDNGPAAPATALVTTGPDGAPLDEGSQQSTLSNASAGTYLHVETFCNVEIKIKEQKHSWFKVTYFGYMLTKQCVLLQLQEKKHVAAGRARVREDLGKSTARAVRRRPRRRAAGRTRRCTTTTTPRPPRGRARPLVP